MWSSVVKLGDSVIVSDAKGGEVAKVTLIGLTLKFSIVRWTTGQGDLCQEEVRDGTIIRIMQNPDIRMVIKYHQKAKAAFGFEFPHGYKIRRGT